MYTKVGLELEDRARVGGTKSGRGGSNHRALIFVDI